MWRLVWPQLQISTNQCQHRFWTCVPYRPEDEGSVQSHGTLGGLAIRRQGLVGVFMTKGTVNPKSFYQEMRSFSGPWYQLRPIATTLL